MNKYIMGAGLLLSAGLCAAEPGPDAGDRQSMAPSVAPKPAVKKPVPHISWRSADGQASFDLGGALRANWRDEHWDTSENHTRWLFDTMRFDLKAAYKKAFIDVNYWFYDLNKRSIDRGYVGYNFTSQSQLQLGLPFKPFGLEPYPQFGWSFHIPFFMGYGVSDGLGAKYSYKDKGWDVQLAYFPRMAPNGTRYSGEISRYADVKDNAIAFTQSGQDNEKRNQVNARVARTFTSGDWKTEVGVSLAASQLYNDTTDDNGSYWAGGLHTVITNGPWTATAEAIRYEYDPKNPNGVSDDSVLMGGNGLTPAYLIASKATLGALNIGYDIHTPNLGQLKKIKIFNDYSRMMKDKSGWDDSQMYTVGVQLFAMPIMAWVDLTWAKNANPYGGSENGTGWTSTSSTGSNEWYYRTNVNIGYYF